MSTPLSSAATPRGTAALSVPATQNTAPVVKFRCLFTHDMRRKAKRWQDGFLRYHTFNKRVMVYDTTGYFIGDLHWRQAEGIQDGDELEMDKGVLIQVCEAVEKTETDLSVLHSNKKKTQDSPLQEGRASVSLSRSSAPIRSSVPSQSQQARSLNELLGIRKTPIAPSRSPFEERQQQRQKEDNRLASERAAKRQKMEARANPSPDGVVPNAPVLIDLSETASEELLERTPTVTPAPKPVSRSTTKTPPSRPGPPPPRKTSSSDVRSAVEPQTVSINAPVPASRSLPAQSAPDAPTRTLRLATSQPRKKLMYQALLPNPPAGKTAPEDKKMRSAQSRLQLAQPLLTQDPSPTNMDFIPTESTMGVLQGIARDVVPESPPRMNGPRGTVMDRPLRPTPTLENRPSGLPPPKLSSKGLRKALSDPTALITSNGVSSQSPRPSSSLLADPIDEHPLEQGPWTSEALDLFDFWPPGRPKPD